MLSDREERQLRGIESQLSDAAPRLERRMRIHAWQSTPHEATPQLPLALLIIGVAGILATGFVSSAGGRVLVAVCSFALIGYALFHLPVNPSPPLGPEPRKHDEG
jgi:hypothetical protein